MAETAAPKGKLDLGKKVGPLPLGGWLLIGGGLFLYFREQQKKTASSSPAAGQSQTGYGTDPSGNTGYIDPSTGYVYGSAEDIAALQSQGLVGANSYNTGGTGATSGTGAAGSTVDTSGQTTGMTNPSGTSVTTPGAPAATVPVASATPGAAAPKSASWQYPAPGGLQAYSVSSGGARIRWNAVKGPNGQTPGTYTVQTWQGNQKVDQFVSGSTDTAEYGAGGKGLKPATSYKVDVWANGGPVAPPHGSVVFTTKPKGG